MKNVIKLAKENYMLKSFTRTSSTDIDSQVQETIAANMNILKDEFIQAADIIKQEVETLKSKLELEHSDLEKQIKLDSENLDNSLSYKVNSLDVKLTYLVESTEKKLMSEIEKIGLKITIKMAGVLTAGIVIIEALHRLFPAF